MELGGTSYAEVLSRRLHMGKGAARRRIADAEQLAPRRVITGEQLAPQLPHTAQALGRGDIGEEHARIIRQFFDRLPTVVDAATREAAEAQLAVMATQFRPEALRVGAERLMALLNPDGQFSDADRARRRGITIGPQGFDGMSAISGYWIRRPALTWIRCSPNSPPPACATRMIKAHSWTPNPQTMPPNAIPAPWHNATTTPYAQPCAPLW
ncbi:Conserved protein of uncharacterised function possible rep13e12 repeat protein [Mycobacteroides abscessus subsp. bolletii]|nr:Conserved protein of uncharacterised function possible rep13e12 repeat protein [Mycobacteroides abscessus subsp. bolletii]